jgi:2'-5' RNA ligase
MSGSGSGTVERGDRLRLFCGLRLPDDVVDRLVPWQEQELRGRIVPRGNLHITLAFLGARPAGELDSIGAELHAAADRAKRPTLTVRGYRETRSVAMLTLEDEGWRAASLAKDLFRRLERLGVYRRESRQWLPHVTVARFQERPRLRPPLPELDPFCPSDAAVYLSRLRPTGAQYEVLDSFALGG